MMIMITMTMIQVGYRHIHWAHQSTNAIRKEYGTTDDLFVRKDVPLVKEEGWDAAEEPLKEELNMEELATDVTEELENLKMGLVPNAKREDL